MCLPLTVTSGTVLAPRYTESAFACSLIGVRDGREYGFFNLNLCLDFSFSLSNSSMEIVSPPPLFFFGGDDRNRCIYFTTKNKLCTQKFSGKEPEHLF